MSTHTASFLPCQGVLLKGASALDALASCSTVALDKTGTITSGDVRLTDAALLQLEAAEGSSNGNSSGSSSSSKERLTLQRVPLVGAGEAAEAGAGAGAGRGVVLLPERRHGVNVGGSLSDQEAELGPGEAAARCAVALSRASNHPVSRALMAAGGDLARGVAVSDFEQVRAAAGGKGRGQET